MGLLEQGVGPDHLQRSLPTSAILRFCETSAVSRDLESALGAVKVLFKSEPGTTLFQVQRTSRLSKVFTVSLGIYSDICFSLV